MKLNISVKSLTKDELVDLFSTALYGCSFLGCSYDASKIDDEARKNQCYEENIADCLLNGGKITITDYYSDGDVYGKQGVNWDATAQDDGNTTYILCLDTLLKGMSSNPESSPYLQQMFVDEDGDYYTANNLLQIALFGDLVY